MLHGLGVSFLLAAPNLWGTAATEHCGTWDQTVFFGELLFGGSGWGVRVGSRAVVLLRRRLGAGSAAQRFQVLSWGRQRSVPIPYPAPFPAFPHASWFLLDPSHTSRTR